MKKVGASPGVYENSKSIARGYMRTVGGITRGYMRTVRVSPGGI